VDLYKKDSGSKKEVNLMDRMKADTIIHYRHNGQHIPSHLCKEIYDYIVNRHTPSSFLRAVIRNDLQNSLELANTECRLNLHAIVNVFYCLAPDACWGSLDKMKAWLNVD